MCPIRKVKNNVLQECYKQENKKMLQRFEKIECQNKNAKYYPYNSNW